MSVGILADRIGRERTLSVASVVFVIGAVIQAASYGTSLRRTCVRVFPDSAFYIDIPTITVGRIILGYGVGVCAGGVPLYISEIAPAKLRGRIIGIEQMILCLGELIAFWLNYGFTFLSTDSWWRIPLAIQVFPAIVLGFGCWTFVPPSPRWIALTRSCLDFTELSLRISRFKISAANISLRES